MLIVRNAFKEENLLLVKHVTSGRAQWNRSEQVLLNCPPFVHYSIPVASYESTYYARLHELLDLPTWDSMHHLQTELENGIADTRLSVAEDKVSYVFQALRSIARDTRISLTPRACPPWVRSILRLPIFPVKSAFGQSTLQALSPHVFVPDSEVLKECFQGKVNLLDFGENDVSEILPVLRCSDARLKYLSHYTSPSTMEVKILEPVSDEISSEEAYDIMQFINATCDQSPTERSDALTEYSLPPFLKRYQLCQTGKEEEGNAEIPQLNIRSGFAGEFFVSPLANLLIVGLSQIE